MFRFTAEPIHLLYSFSFVSITTFVPQLFIYKACLQEYTNNDTLCQNLSSNVNLQGDIQEKASFWQMVYLVTTNGLSFFTVLIWGPLTDVIGRRKGYLYSSVCLILAYIVLFLNTYYMDLSPAYVLIAAVLTGSYGDSSGIISLSYAYIADFTEESVRTKRMAFLESFFYLGFLLGGLSCGYLIKYLGFIFVPIVNGCIAILALLYAYFIIEGKSYREKAGYLDDLNINADQNEKFNWYLVNPFHHMKKVCLIFTHADIRVAIAVMFFVYFGVMLAANGDLILSPFYLDYAPFNASSDIIGYYVSLTGLLAALGALVTFLFTIKFKVTDAYLLIFGLITITIGFVLTGISRSLYIVFAVRVFQAALPVCTSISRCLTTKIAGRNCDHGSVLAGMECLDTLSATLASLLLGVVYKSTFRIYSGISFFLLAVITFILLISFSIMWFIKRRKIHIEECLFDEE